MVWDFLKACMGVVGIIWTSVKYSDIKRTVESSNEYVLSRIQQILVYTIFMFAIELVCLTLLVVAYYIKILSSRPVQSKSNEKNLLEIVESEV